MEGKDGDRGTGEEGVRGEEGRVGGAGEKSVERRVGRGRNLKVFSTS